MFKLIFEILENLIYFYLLWTIKKILLFETKKKSNLKSMQLHRKLTIFKVINVQNWYKLFAAQSWFMTVCLAKLSTEIKVITIEILMLDTLDIDFCGIWWLKCN